MADRATELLLLPYLVSIVMLLSEAVSALTPLQTV